MAGTQGWGLQENVHNKFTALVPLQKSNFCCNPSIKISVFIVKPNETIRQKLYAVPRIMKHYPTLW